MNPIISNDNECCSKVSILLENVRSRDLVLCEQMDKILAHFATCPSCLMREKQLIDITEQASAIPDMEAPANMMPSIMKAIALESVSANSPVTVSHIKLPNGFINSQLIMVSVAAVAIALLASNSFDSQDGWYAWSACLCLMFVQQLFFSKSSKLRVLVNIR